MEQVEIFLEVDGAEDVEHEKDVENEEDLEHEEGINNSCNQISYITEKQRNIKYDDPKRAFKKCDECEEWVPNAKKKCSSGHEIVRFTKSMEDFVNQGKTVLKEQKMRYEARGNTLFYNHHWESVTFMAKVSTSVKGKQSISYDRFATPGWGQTFLNGQCCDPIQKMVVGTFEKAIEEKRDAKNHIKKFPFAGRTSSKLRKKTSTATRRTKIADKVAKFSTAMSNGQASPCAPASNDLPSPCVPASNDLPSPCVPASNDLPSPCVPDQHKRSFQRETAPEYDRNDEMDILHKKAPVTQQNDDLESGFDDTADQHKRSFQRETAPEYDRNDEIDILHKKAPVTQQDDDLESGFDDTASSIARPIRKAKMRSSKESTDSVTTREPGIRKRGKENTKAKKTSASNNNSMKRKRKKEKKETIMCTGCGEKYDEKTDDNRWVQCDACDQWCHLQCSGIKYRTSKYDTINLENIPFKCRTSCLK